MSGASFKCAMAGVVCLLMAGGSASAAIVTTTWGSTSLDPLAAVSSTDLVNQGTATLLSYDSPNFTSINSSTLGALNNGVASTANAEGSLSQPLTSDWTVYFHLNTTTNTSGYDITSISSLTASTDNRRARYQKYTIEYSTVTSNPTNSETTGFATLGTFNAYQIQPAGSLQGVMTLADNSAMTLGGVMSGVNVIKVTFNYSDPTYGGNYAAVYREFDVFGAAIPVPEPATLGLTLAGLVMLACVRSKHAGGSVA